MAWVRTTGAPLDATARPAPHQLAMALAPTGLGGGVTKGEGDGGFEGFNGVVLGLQMDRGATVPVTVAVCMSGVVCPATALLAGGGAYHPLHEGSSVTSWSIQGEAQRG